MKPLHVIHRSLAALTVAAVGVQFLLAGAGAFGATSFKAHTGLGWAILVLSLLALLTAALGRREVRATGALVAAVVVQVVLGVLGENASSWFGAVHGLNALVVAGAALNLARRTAQATGDRRRPATADMPTAGTPSR